MTEINVQYLLQINNIDMTYEREIERREVGGREREGEGVRERKREREV